MATTPNVTSRSDRSRQTSYNGQSQSSTMYQGKSDDTGVRSQENSSDSPSTAASANQPFMTAHRSYKHVRLVPVKVKEVMRMIESNPEYNDTRPVLMNVHSDSINRMVEQGNIARLSKSSRTSPRPSPISLAMSSEREYARHDLERTSGEPRPSRPPLGDAIDHQVYAMTDIQAYPVVGTEGFRSDSSPTRIRQRRVSPRRRRSKPKKIRVRKPRSAVVLTRPRRSRSRSRVRRRKMSPRRPRSRPRKVVRVRRPRQAVVEVPRRMRRPPLYELRCSPPCQPACQTYCPPSLYGDHCTPYPLCENDCYPAGRSYYGSGRYGRQSRTEFTCSCSQCQEKLQFIQPGVCPKKKYMWTNEYAVIPKPQVNLIDPCDQLDPSIYPRADNPCIRDANGNPLTDCIGRPLRDPVGKRFLKFSANGSVMNTNFRGNFYTGQPPLCVKCPMPGTSCAPDTTHNYWMSCGYPIMPDMSPFFERIVADEHNRR